MESNKLINHITILIYAHPELYPPTLSAISELSKVSDSIDVITRNMLVSQWDYPDNVTISYTNSEEYQGFEIEKVSFIKKASHFWQFLKKAKKTIKTNKSELVIAYDAIPLYTTLLLKTVIEKSNSLLWYHNHDVTDLRHASRYSLMKLANKNEKKEFERINLFSLPSIERVQYFPVESLNHDPIILPNFPLKSFYSKVNSSDLKNDTKIKLVFQGSIGSGHGLEEILSILNEKVQNKTLELHLVGKIRPIYLRKLEDLATSFQTQDKFFYHGMKPFAQLPKYLSQFHIGLAIHMPYNITYSTGGTASNKIYEYAALGLPVLLFDNEHYRSHLGSNNWSYFTDTTKKSLLKSLEMIEGDYSLSSQSALNDFNHKYNFEVAFSSRLLPALKNLLISSKD